MSETLQYVPYPDPSYPGVISVTPRRFWIGPVHNGPWDGVPPNEWVYMNYQQPWQIGNLSPFFPWDIYDGDFSSINISDPANSYIELTKNAFETDFPTFVSGSEIYQNLGNTWTTVLPWDATERAFWLYPNPILTTTKIYYNNQYIYHGVPPFSRSGDHAAFSWNVEVAGSGSVPFTVNPSDPDIVWHFYFSDNMESVVTECGEDENGTWIKVRACIEGDGGWPGHIYDQINVCAGNGLIVAPRSTASTYGWVEIIPWGRKTRTGSIYETDSVRNRIVQRETPSMIYMSEYTDAYLSYPMGICNDGTNLYVLSYTNGVLVKYLMGALATNLTYVLSVTAGTATYMSGICCDGTYLYYCLGNFGVIELIKRRCSDLGVETSISSFNGGMLFSVPQGMTIDSTYLYVGDRINIYKFNKSDLSYVSWSQVPDPDKISGLDNDGTYLYASIFKVPVV